MLCSYTSAVKTFRWPLFSSFIACMHISLSVDGCTPCVQLPLADISRLLYLLHPLVLASIYLHFLSFRKWHFRLFRKGNHWYVLHGPSGSPTQRGNSKSLLFLHLFKILIQNHVDDTGRFSYKLRYLVH